MPRIMSATVDSKRGGDFISETSVLTIATEYEVPEDIYDCSRRENIPEDRVLRH
jgi:hypothetical protein